MKRQSLESWKYSTVWNCGCHILKPLEGLGRLLPRRVRAGPASRGPQQLAEGVHRLRVPRAEGHARLRQDPPGPRALPDPVHVPLHPPVEAERAGAGDGAALPMGDGVPLPGGDGSGGVPKAAHWFH